jgi:outer membrane protein insertion porin family
MRPSVCVALLFLWAVLSAAQAPASRPAAQKKQPGPGVLRSVTVKGNSRYSSEAIGREIGWKTGQAITPADIESARAQLQSTELFNSVSDSFRYSGSPLAYDVTFTVIENDQVFPMRFERFGVAPEAIKSCLKQIFPLYSDQIPGTEGVLKRYKQAAQTCVSEAKSPAQVKATVSNDAPKQLTVLFAPEGPTITISQVTVSGNEALDTGTILRAVNQVAIGVPLSDMRLKMILDGAIKPLYAAKGYAAVTFPKVETEPSKTDRGVVVKVQIKDGPVFKFGGIHFQGTGMDQDEIRANIPFKPGQQFNGKQVDDFRLWLVHSLRRKGLLDTSVTFDTQLDDSRRAVDVTYTVTPGALYSFQKLDIQGLDINSSPVVERLWGEKPGKPFNPDYPEFFLKRVEEQGLFDNLGNTSSDYTADPATHGVTVHLYFKGGKSKQDRAKEKKDEEERQKSDGTWSPIP